MIKRGKQRDGGVGLTAKNVAPRPTARSKTFGAMGGHQREGCEDEGLGWRPPSPPCRVRGAAAPSTLEDTPSEAPATGGGREGGGSGVRVRVGGGGSGIPQYKADRMFSFYPVLFFWQTGG